MAINSESWFLQSNNHARPFQMFCIPYAGGSAAAYARWRDVIDPRIDLIPVQLPGRGTRIRERPLTRIQEMAAQLTEALAPQLDRPFALFGHSMGSVLAFETARALRQQGLRQPKALFVSGRRAPQQSSDRPPLHGLPEPQLIAELRRMGGTPPAVLQDKDLLELVLPVLRADLTAIETYAYQPGAPLDCPMLAFGGTQDSVPMTDLEAWSEQTANRFELSMLSGGHFFINAHYKAMLRRMSDCFLQETG